MKTEDIDKKIGMPDVDAEWAKFEREVIGEEQASNKSIKMWGLSIAASIALLAGIFLLGNPTKEKADMTVAKVEQPTTPDVDEVATTEKKNAPGTDVVSETKTASELFCGRGRPRSRPVQRPVEQLLAMTPPSNTKVKMEGNGNKVVEEPDTRQPVEQEKVFSVTEQNPGFPGGDRALQEFIKMNQRYPDLAMEYGAKGRVITTFLIDSLGYVSDIKVFKCTRMSYDTLRLSQETVEKQEQVKEQIALQLGEESTRILSLMPRWAPGKMNGKAVNVRYTVPVQFQFSEAEQQMFLAQKQLDTNNETALRGHIAGLDISSTSADLGTDYIRVRGNRNGNDSILILVNGTPMPDSQNLNSDVMARLRVDLYRKGQFIHGISVYKDEKNIKQYGERGKNGVISLTTTPDTLCDAYIREHPELKQHRKYVEGYVMNEKDEPIADAWVGTLAGAATDSTGHFALWLPLTQKDLLATCTGYKSSRQQVDTTGSTLLFRLKKQISLKEVRIHGKKETEGKAIPLKEIRIR